MSTCNSDKQPRVPLESVLKSTNLTRPLDHDSISDSGKTSCTTNLSSCDEIDDDTLARAARRERSAKMNKRCLGKTRTIASTSRSKSERTNMAPGGRKATRKHKSADDITNALRVRCDKKSTSGFRKSLVKKEQTERRRRAKSADFQKKEDTEKPRARSISPKINNSIQRPSRKKLTAEEKFKKAKKSSHKGLCDIFAEYDEIHQEENFLPVPFFSFSKSLTDFCDEYDAIHREEYRDINEYSKSLTGW